MFGKSIVFILTLSTALTLAACQDAERNNEQFSTPPAPVNPLSHNAHQPLPATPGILLAALPVAASLDGRDNFKERQAETRAEVAPVGQQVTWNNPDSGHSGNIVALRDGYSAQGAYCRTFQQRVTIDGVPSQTTGKACQQPDGSWKTSS